MGAIDQILGVRSMPRQNPSDDDRLPIETILTYEVREFNQVFQTLPWHNEPEVSDALFRFLGKNTTGRKIAADRYDSNSPATPRHLRH
jgi:hypothetical protein